ncbi:MAG: cytochrome b [Pseudomonadales bacterium]|nr:cytochrome b [Pseudomonadales bacterium]
MERYRFSSFSIGMHWLMLLLIAAVYTCIEIRGYFPRGSDTRELVKTWHYMLGLSVFLLVWVRLAALAVLRRPAMDDLPRWQQVSSKAVHVALYALMIGMPMLGWVILSADGKVIPFFGLELPPLIAPNDAIVHDLEEIHETIGNVGYFLIGLHAAAALFHHYILGDRVLAGMLPWRLR